MRPGVYVHIPFCEQRCYYCAFTVAVSPQHAHEPYLRRLIREIQLSQFSEEPETIFFGGGTPSIIDGVWIQKILAALTKGAKEISLEANPGTLDQAKLECYAGAGINRISLGAQSFHDEDLKNAGRLHNSADVFRDIESLRKHGFNNINIDLIAGLPNQQFDVWRQNLANIEHIRPEHVSIYMLDVEDRSVWGRREFGIPTTSPPDSTWKRRSGFQEPDTFIMKFRIGHCPDLNAATTLSTGRTCPIGDSASARIHF